MWALLKHCSWCAAAPSAASPGCQGPGQPLLALSAVSLCLSRVPGTELAFRGWTSCRCPEGRAEQGRRCSPRAAWAARVHSAASPQNVFTGGADHCSFWHAKKIIVRLQGEERGRVSSNDIGMEACREWWGGKQPMAHESHWLDRDLLCAAHRWRFLTCKVLLSALRGQQLLRSY